MERLYVWEGYEIFPGAVPESHLEGLKEALTQLFRLEAVSDFPDYASADLVSLLQHCEACSHERVYQSATAIGSSLTAYELLSSASVVKLAAELLECDTSCLHVMPLTLQIQFPANDQFDYTWHQESTYYPWCSNLLSLWFPLELPSSRISGTMEVIPGSHLCGKREHQVYYRDGIFRQNDISVSEAEERLALPIEINPGDLVAFHEDMIHRTVPNQGSQPRLTGIVRIVDVRTLQKVHPLYKAFSYQEELTIPDVALARGAKPA
jgi:ectoine hydroxylase-related dioxygenase (phytanoyl-CoA dioxygenase family)